VNETEKTNTGRGGSPSNPTRLYILLAVLFAVVIVVAGILLITKGIPALKSGGEPTAATAGMTTATSVPTFTPGPTKAPTNTPPPALSPTPSALVMSDTDTPLFSFESAGARPGVQWTGFFGQVFDSQGNPMPGASLIVWYRDGTPASRVVKTDDTGTYEIRLADAPLAGTWSIQVLTDDWQPASKLFTFTTDENTETGIQQIQVIWRRVN
jgi:hypothetical protein